MAGAGVFSGLGQGTVVDAAGSLSSPRFEAKGGEQTSGNAGASNRDEPARSCWCSSINTVVCPRLFADCSGAEPTRTAWSILITQTLLVLHLSLRSGAGRGIGPLN